ncbi:hypothetical protein BLA29_006720, partial [Euroglyphus maynei]
MMRKPLPYDSTFNAHRMDHNFEMFIAKNHQPQQQNGEKNELTTKRIANNVIVEYDRLKNGDISLIINDDDDSNRIMLKNDNHCLEERPSPSGSSGSSDRISSSLNTYNSSSPNRHHDETFIDVKFHKMNNNDNNANVEMAKNSFPHRFVPNSNSIARHGNNIADFNELSHQQQQKNYMIIATKPSVPVKPIATTAGNKDLNESTNNNNTNNNKIQRNSCSENDHNEHKGEHHSNSVVEIVNKLNNLSCQESWDKLMKRRPVYNTNEMEKELEKSSPIHSDESSLNHIVAANDESHDTVDDKCSLLNDNKHLQQDDALNNNN